MAEIVIEVTELLDAFRDVQANESLMFVDLAWAGCSGCQNPELAPGLAYVESAFSNVKSYGIPWRNTGGSPSQSFEVPVTHAYTLFTEIVRGHMQEFGDSKEVENYSANPPWARVHFPQLFFIDGRKINNPVDNNRQNPLNEIGSLNDSGELFNENGELILWLEGGQSQLREYLANTIYGGGVLLQLLNEHVFALPNRAFQLYAFQRSVDCVVQQISTEPDEPTSCFRYHRVERE